MSPSRTARFFLILAFVAAWFQASPNASAASPVPDVAVDLRVEGSAAPGWTAATGPLAAFGYRAGAGFGYRSEGWVPVRGRADFFFNGDSAWDATWFRFRSFWGLRFGAMTGWAFPVGPVRIEALAGGAVSMSRYTGVSAVTAYPSILAEIGASWQPGGAGSASGSRSAAPILFAALPMEFMFRGTARTLSAGIGAGVALPVKRR